MIPYTLNAFAYMLLYIGVYQFILSQSPHRMRGLVIGSFFAIKGIFQLLAILTVYLPFISWSSDSSFPSCGFVYYLINIIIALIGIIFYTWATVKYQHRRQEDTLLTENFFEECYSRNIAVEESEDLVYKVKDDDNWIQREPKMGNSPSTPQATNTHNATSNKQRATNKLPGHISSRNKSEK